MRAIRYDFVYYGSLLNVPQILTGVFGSNDTVQDVCWQGLLANGASVPGVILGILALKCLTAKQLQAWGFLAMALVRACVRACVHACVRAT